MFQKDLIVVKFLFRKDWMVLFSLRTYFIVGMNFVQFLFQKDLILKVVTKLFQMGLTFLSLDLLFLLLRRIVHERGYLKRHMELYCCDDFQFQKGFEHFLFELQPPFHQNFLLQRGFAVPHLGGFQCLSMVKAGRHRLRKSDAFQIFFQIH